MKIGATLFPTDYSIDIAVFARRAEELGFDTVWVPEHPIIPVTTASPWPGSPDGIIPKFYAEMVDPFVALARASAVTKTIKLGIGICLVPERNPLLLAKEVATLDYCCGGRFIFGIGAGWLREETEIMGGNFLHRWAQTQEGVEALKELWSKDEAEYHGKYYDFPPVKSFPKPVQKPHPPIYLGGSARNVFKRTVEWGDGWMPTRSNPEEIRRGRATLDALSAKAGRDPRSIEVLAYGAPGEPETLKAFEEAGPMRCPSGLAPSRRRSPWRSSKEWRARSSPSAGQPFRIVLCQPRFDTAFHPHSNSPHQGGENKTLSPRWGKVGMGEALHQILS